MRLYLDTPLELNDDVEIALSPSISFHASVVWVNGRNCGVAFEACSDGAPVRTSAAADRQSARKSGTARPNANFQGRSEHDGSDEAASETQARQSSVFVPGLRVKVLLDSGRERCAVVRWSRDNIAELFLS